MKTTTKKIDNYESEITVEYDVAELEKAKKRACQKLSERVSIPGFRKGKVPPPWVIEQHLGKGVILDEAADILTQKGANDVINELNIIPVTKMKPNIITCEEGKPFVFTLTFTPYPDVTLGEYKNLATTKTVEPVSDSDVDEQIEHIRNHHANLIDAQDTTTVQSGDTITVTYSGSLNGSTLNGDVTLAVSDKGDSDSELENVIAQNAVGTTLNQPFTVSDTLTCTVTNISRPDPAVQSGDFITLDFTGTVNGEKFDGGEAKDFPLEIGSHKFIGDFEEQLIGSKIGDTTTVKVTFPDNYHVKDLAGKPAVFTCTVHSIKHKSLPDLDDAFAKKASKFDTLAEFKADIKKNMESAADRRATEAQQDAAIELAADNMTVDIPPVMIEDKITQLVSELEANLNQRGMKLDEYLAVSGLDLEGLRDTYKDAALKSVRVDILLDAVAKAENIDVDNKELNIELQYMAAMYRTTPKQVYKILSENRQISTLIANVMRRKSMKFIIDNMAKAEPDKDK